MNECVYVIHGKGTDRYKIGFTNNLRRRLKALQHGSPVDLDVISIHYTDAHIELERLLHKYFASERVYGEWFALTTEAISYLRQETGDILEHLGISDGQTKIEDISLVLKDARRVADAYRDPLDLCPILKHLIETLIKRNAAGESWAAMAREYDVNPAVLWRIVKENYNPKKAELRAKLGLPELITLEIHHNDDGYKMEQTV